MIQTAGRLAGEETDPGLDHAGSTIEALWIFEVPMALPIDARLPDAQLDRARAALRRAKAVGEEYEGVEVATATVRARRAGTAIVDEARRRGVQAIVLAAEEPSRIRGGALLGGRGGPMDNFVGDATKYVVSKASCEVILTAPPSSDVPVTARSIPSSIRPRGDGAPATTSRSARCRRAERRRRSHFVRPTHPRGAERARWVRFPSMFILIVGAGRVGSSVARSSLAAGHTVSVLDEDPLSHERLEVGMDRTWEEAGGRFTVGHGMEVDALTEAGILDADVFIASTDGDNTNLTISQIAQKHYEVEKVIVRVMDPARAAWYREQGLHTICPTQHAIEMFTSALGEIG